MKNQLKSTKEKLNILAEEHSMEKRRNEKEESALRARIEELKAQLQDKIRSCNCSEPRRAFSPERDRRDRGRSR